MTTFRMRELAVLGLASLPLVVVCWVRMHRYRFGPAICLAATNAVAAVLFLPPVAGATGRRGSLEVFGIVVGLGLTLSLSAAVAQGLRPYERAHRRAARLDRSVAALIALAGIGGVVGILSGNPLRFVVGDTFELLALAGAYLIGRVAAQGTPLRTLFITLLAILVFQQARDAFEAVRLLTAEGSPTRIHSVLWIQNIVAVALAIALALEPGGRITRRTWFAYIAIGTLGIGIASGFRTYFLILFVMMLASLFLRRRSRIRTSKTRSTLIVGLALTPAIALILATPLRPVVERPIDAALERGHALASGGSQDLSAYERGLETRVIASELSADGGTLLVGRGAGATYHLPSDASPFSLALYQDQDFEVHYIHNSFASFLFRHGVVGLGVYLAFLLSALRVTLQFAREDDRHLARAVFFVSIGYLATTPFFTLIPGDVVLGLLLGIASGRLRSIRLEGDRHSAARPAILL